MKAVEYRLPQELNKSFIHKSITPLRENCPIHRVSIPVKKPTKQTAPATPEFFM